jgi:uroporphyrinogen decarboxylase
MTPKERVQAALRRTSADRVPLFMWFHPETTGRLAAALEVPREFVAEVLGNDVRQTWVGNNYAMEGILHEHDGDIHRDDWGIEWVKVGPFNQILSSPLQEGDDDAVRAYEFPVPRIDALVHTMDALAGMEGEFFLGCDISPCLFEMICRLRGMEQATLDLAANPSLAEHLLDKARDFAVILAETACSRYRLDWLWTGDDVAGQKTMIMSPATWRREIKPRLADIVAVGKRHGLPVAYHCCGALRPIIPDLVDIGINVLNPLQCDCPGMDAAELKRDFGAVLTFMGGVDTVDLLPRGSAAEVHRVTAKLIEIMTADGGGYILAASHTIPPETPLENIFALFAAAGIRKREIFDRAADTRNTLLQRSRGD